MDGHIVYNQAIAVCMRSQRSSLDWQYDNRPARVQAFKHKPQKMRCASCDGLMTRFRKYCPACSRDRLKKEEYKKNLNRKRKERRAKLTDKQNTDKTD